MKSVKDLMPVGSVVLLEGGTKKVIIVGILQAKNQENGNTMIYDYLGVPYPEGYLGEESAFLFQHASIREVAFRGYDDEERETFLNLLEKVVASVDVELQGQPL